MRILGNPTLPFYIKHFLSLLIIALVLVACNFIDRAPNASSIVQTPDAVAQIDFDNPVIYTSIPELSSKSDLIIVGQATDLNEIINTSRKVDDPTKPNSEHFGIGQVYEVQVDKYLKGSDAKIIYVVQNQGYLLRSSGPPTTEQIAEAQKACDDIPLTLNKKYLMFLIDTSHIFPELSKKEYLVTAPSGHPWLFDLSDPDCVRYEDALGDLDRNFPSQPLASLLAQIDQPFTPAEFQPPGPYPAPVQAVQSLCPSGAGKPYPIPPFP